MNQDLVIVSVKRSTEFLEFDLEVSPYIPAKDLVESISVGLSFISSDKKALTNYQLFVTPPGKILKQTETLADVGAWDGSVIELVVPGDKIYTPSEPENKKEVSSVIQGFIPIEGVPKEKPEEIENNQGGYF